MKRDILMIYVVCFNADSNPCFMCVSVIETIAEIVTKWKERKEQRGQTVK